VALGGNDGLRALPPAQSRASLAAILDRLKARGIPVLLAGMLAPPNMGPAYAQTFNAIYQDLATKHGLILYPFFLDGIALDQRFNLNDGLHPNSKGVAEITQKIVDRPCVLARIGERR